MRGVRGLDKKRNIGRACGRDWTGEKEEGKEGNRPKGSVRVRCSAGRAQQKSFHFSMAEEADIVSAPIRCT